MHGTCLLRRPHVFLQATKGQFDHRKAGCTTHSLSHILWEIYAKLGPKLIGAIIVAESSAASIPVSARRVIDGETESGTFKSSDGQLLSFHVQSTLVHRLIL